VVGIEEHGTADAFDALDALDTSDALNAPDALDPSEAPGALDPSDALGSRALLLDGAVSLLLLDGAVSLLLLDGAVSLVDRVDVRSEELLGGSAVAGVQFHEQRLELVAGLMALAAEARLAEVLELLPGALPSVAVLVVFACLVPLDLRTAGDAGYRFASRTAP